VIENLPKVGYFCISTSVGNNQNVIDSPSATRSSNVYKTPYPTFSEYCIFSSSPLKSKYVLGGTRIIESEFSINCYNSLRMTRCLEMDACNNCADSYFCHNSDDLSESMFCWNAKSKRYAIGNAQLQPDQYRKIKDALVSQMADEIIRNKELKWDIYNIGCVKS